MSDWGPPLHGNCRFDCFIASRSKYSIIIDLGFRVWGIIWVSKSWYNYIGRMEKKMETTIMGYIGIMGVYNIRIIFPL